MSEAPSARGQQVVNRLIRLHNLLFFVVVVWGLACFLIVRATHIFPRPPALMWLLTTLCVLLPILTLVLATLATNRLIRLYVQREPGRPVTADAIAPCFARSKILSIVMGAVSGLLAATCLLLGHRVREVILVILPLVIMLLMRPTPLALVHFVRLAEIEREEQFGPQ